MNKVVLIGRITKDPELRTTPTGVPVVQFSIAVNRTYQNQNGERQADFISCVAWRNQAENLAKFIRKGGLIAVDGSIQTRQYDDQSGARRFVTEVICNQITFLESKKQDGGYGDLSQITPPQQNSYRNNNYNQNSYQQNNYSSNNMNNQLEDKNPFEDINRDFDITNDDLPF